MNDLQSNRPTCITASMLKRVVSCPKSYLLGINIPDRETEASLRGTYFHKCVENYILNKMLSDEVDSDDKLAIEYCAEKFNAFRPPNADFDLEKRFYIYDNEKLMFSGQIDAFYITEEGAFLFDWKSGERAVEEAVENLQMMSYAWLLFKNFSELKKVQVNIISPFVKNGKRSTTAIYSRSDIEAVEPKILEIIRQANSEDAPYAKEVGDYCHFCKARAICEVQMKNATSIAPLTDDYSVVSSENAVDIYQKLEIFNKRKLEAEKWADALKERLEKYVLETKDERFTFKKGRKLEVYDTFKTFSAVSQIIPAEKFLTACKVNKTQLIDIVSEISGINKNKASQAFENACENVGAITRTFAKDSLVLTNSKER